MTGFLILLFSMVTAYLIGSIPTGYIFGRMLKGIDIREHGSGNVGATNVFRVLGKIPGVIVLALDIFKGVIVVTLLAGMWYRLMAGITLFPASNVLVSASLFKIMLGLAVIAGHIWTAFLKFKGGKGVATAAGVIIGLDPLTVGIAIGIFIVVFVFTRYVSLGSIIAAVSVPVLIAARGFVSKETVSIPFLIFSMAVSMTIIYRHKSNIGRLLRGEENKINFKRKT